MSFSNISFIEQIGYIFAYFPFKDIDNTEECLKYLRGVGIFTIMFFFFSIIGQIISSLKCIEDDIANNNLGSLKYMLTTIFINFLIDIVLALILAHCHLNILVICCSLYLAIKLIGSILNDRVFSLYNITPSIAEYYENVSKTDNILKQYNEDYTIKVKKSQQIWSQYKKQL